MPHLQKQALCAAFGGILRQLADQLLRNSQAAIPRSDRQQQQLFFIVTSSRKEKAGTFALVEGQRIMAIAGQQRIFDLPPVPGLAKGRIEGCDHDLHDPVKIVGRRDQAGTWGRRASGARP